MNSSCRRQSRELWLYGGRIGRSSGQWLLAAKDDGETVAWNIPVIRRELAKLGLDWEDSQTKVETGKPRSEGKATSE